MKKTDIRPLLPEEAALAAEVEDACFADAWTEQSIREEMESPLGLYLGAWREGAFVGYIGTRMVLDEGEIHRVAVLPAYRRQGIAGELVRELFRQTEQIAVWFLEVRAGNLPARCLYEQLGFLSIGIRKNYYHDPQEDAVNMQLVRGDQ